MNEAVVGRSARHVALGACVLALCGHPARAADQIIRFTDYPPLARVSEMLRRLASPLAADEVRRDAARQGVTLAEQPLALDRESFVLHVPPMPTDGRYALLAFVSPWADAHIPQHWLPVLDRHSMIFISAANTGNDAATLGRREPLALIAALDVMARYPVDPQRVYVGGFSGGAKVALRLAIGYPDLFRGALLDAGSETLGDAIPPPPADLLHRFQEDSRVVYLSGERDDFHRDEDRHSRHSLAEWCAVDTDAETIAWTAHDEADPAAFGHAIDALADHTAADPADLAACRARTDGELRQQLDQAQALITARQAGPAKSLLRKIDATYGGLAAPRSVALLHAAEAMP